MLTPTILPEWWTSLFEVKAKSHFVNCCARTKTVAITSILRGYPTEEETGSITIPIER